MAVTNSNSIPFFLSLFLFCSLSFFSPAVLSRPVASPAATAKFDISASLARTTEVLSFDPETQQSLHQQQPHRRQHSSLTLQLHSRDFLRRTTHKDYKSLTLARLARDAARVRALTTRLDLAVHGINRADLKPILDDEAAEMASTLAAWDGSGMQGPVVSGTSQGSGEYFSRVSIGRPAKSLYMVLDTGSDVTWVQCQPCTDCYQQADPMFDPASSSTYAPVTCDSPQCHSLDVSACRNTTCLYQVSYGDGSYTVGDFATDTVSFGDGEGASVPNVAFGCGHDNEGLFVGAAGLLGLGGGSLSFPSQVSASSFSYCLVDRDSTSTSTLDFGRNGSDYSSSASSADMVTAPLIRNRKLDTFYYVGLTGLSVGGQMLSIPSSAFAMDEAGSGGVIIDSGTAVTRLNPDAYSALRDAFAAGTKSLPTAPGVALFDTCYDLSSKTSVEVPTVSFHFPEGRALRLPAKNYLIPVDSTGTFCLAFAPASSASGLSIIGNVQQQGTRVSFDLENGHFGFASNKC